MAGPERSETERIFRERADELRRRQEDFRRRTESNRERVRMGLPPIRDDEPYIDPDTERRREALRSSGAAGATKKIEFIRTTTIVTLDNPLNRYID